MLYRQYFSSFSNHWLRYLKLIHLVSISIMFTYIKYNILQDKWKYCPMWLWHHYHNVQWQETFKPYCSICRSGDDVIRGTSRHFHIQTLVFEYMLIIFHVKNTTTGFLKRLTFHQSSFGESCCVDLKLCFGLCSEPSADRH